MAINRLLYSWFQARSLPTYSWRVFNHCCIKDVARSNTVLPRTDAHWTQYWHWACYQRSFRSFRSLWRQLSTRLTDLHYGRRFVELVYQTLYTTCCGHSMMEQRHWWNNITGSPSMQAVKPIHQNVRCPAGLRPCACTLLANAWRFRAWVTLR